MTAVVDASVLVAALVDSGSEGKWAESALAEGPLAGPELALAEASNILRRLERAGHISQTRSHQRPPRSAQARPGVVPVHALCRACVGLAHQPDQLRRLVCGPGRGPCVPFGDAGQKAQPRERPHVRGHHSTKTAGERYVGRISEA